ncbi:SLIT and NTRK-like protein 4 [Chironomus tepperi]|uniref:SLIT and NTRK-like protein 4 n=1 Tax=Chironomus tepperi TaxID=113505 RepID=UPI00391F0401
METIATNAVGTHIYGKGISDVDVLLVSTQSFTKFLPTKSCNVFKNLKKFEISGRFVKKLDQNVFSRCSKVNEIRISHTKLTEIDENLFFEVPNLTIISITFTNIEILQKNLFKNNQKLSQINLSFNKFKAISTEIPISVTKLLLQGNTCIDDIYVKEMSMINPIINFVKEIYNKCKNGTFDNIAIEQVKGEQIMKRIDDNKDRTLEIEEYVEYFEWFFQDDIKDIIDNETKKEFVIKLQNLTKTVKNFHDLINQQSDLNREMISKFTEEIQIISEKIDQNMFENQKINNNLNSKLSRENGRIITMFCFQIASTIAIMVLIYMRKY